MSHITDESSMKASICEICRCDVENPTNFCNEAHDPSCKDCVIAYIESNITTSFLGSCPIIYCPSTSHQKGKKRKILPYAAWKEHIKPEVHSKYQALSNSVLAFLCGGCHSLKSLDLGFEGNRSNACYTGLDKMLSDLYGGHEKFAELEARLRDYCIGDISLEEIYRYFQELFPNLVTMSDEDAWNIMSKILKIIQDPERRGNLHLRYLRDRPRMKTLCCNREHCFRCKIKDFHEGKSCMESTASLDQSIVTCPSCGIALARGDGCNTITCVCGKQFSWTQEKENTERCHGFLQVHPEETSTHCAIVLCTRTPSPLLTQAKAWQTRNRIEVNRALTDWFKKKYWPCPSQCCTILVPDTLPDGVKEAIELWKNTHVSDVNKCKEQNDIASRSIFLNLVKDPKDRPLVAYRLVSQARRSLLGNVDEKLVQSAMKWIDKNRELYSKELENYEVRSAKQFLFLFGNKPVKSILPAFAQCPSGSEWCRTASNPDLTYSNNNTTVERVGSVSCYPAAFCKLTADKCMFRVAVDAAPKSSNWLTFGVAKKGMANSSSDGVGRTSNTWGLSDDRSSSSNHTIVAASGTEVGQFRKLRAGDILTASVDTVDGWCEVSVNEDEFIHRFVIPPGSAEDYLFAMSFANDHRVTIISDSITVKKTAPNKAGELNSDHTIMYNNLRKQLRNLLVEVDETSTGANLAISGLITDGSEWLNAHSGKEVSAQESFECIKPSIEAILSVRNNRTKEEIENGDEVLNTVSWKMLVEAVSWYRHNRDRIREEQKTIAGLTFHEIHGDDAAFMAAMNLVEYHTHKVDKEDSLASLAYMHMFPEEMNVWYDYNASLREPVIENIVKTCRCLPRHIRTCPLVKK